MKSKICGIPSLEVAERVIATRPDAIGIYCWTNPEKGRNFTDKETARRIARLAADSSIESFYLMYEDSSISSEKAYEDCSFIGNTHIQIVGDMQINAIIKLKHRLPSLQIVKRVGVAGLESIQEALMYDACEGVDQLLLDSSSGNVARGGTGKAHDWSVSRQIVEQCSKPVWLAGGMRLHNVEDAMGTVRPYGIDVETGVQLPDGSKDYPAIEEFITKVHNFSQ
jgi:phosphoribosylanthranilate isomerase